MTAVRLGIVRPTADGTLTRVKGMMEFTPHARRITDTEPTDVVVPASFRVVLDPAAEAPVVHLAAGWVWIGSEFLPEGIRRHVLVPDSDEVVDWADLVDVDPATLEPSPEAVAGWSAVLAEVQEAAMSASQGAVLATSMSTATETAAARAEAAADRAHMTISHDPTTGAIIIEQGVAHA